MSALVARKAIQAVGKIALKLPARANACVDKLLSLFNFETDYITSEILIVMTSKDIIRKYCGHFIVNFQIFFESLIIC